MVNLGGNIYAYGNSSKHIGWQIGIRDPRDKNNIVKKITLRDQAISTSGDYEQFFFHEGKRYTHIIDPRTGCPAEGMVSVSVVAKDAMTADALSTACFVLGVDRSKALIESLNNVEVLIFYDENDEIKRFATEGFVEN